MATCTYDRTAGVSGSGGGSVIETLLAEGVSREDIRMALDFQAAQRKAGVTVLSLRTICGRGERRDRASAWKASSALASTPAPAPGSARRAKPAGGIHVTRRPVHAGSIEAGSAAEDDFVRPVPAPLAKQMIGACYKLFKLAKQARHDERCASRQATLDETRLYGFTAACRDIAIRLIDEGKFRKGWCMPSYETIMRWTGYSRTTVARALRKLADLGLIEWIKRFTYSKDEVAGTRIEQTSNLYRFKLPDWLTRLASPTAPPPPPDDADHARAADTEDHAFMLASLLPEERLKAMPADDSLRAKLIAAAIAAESRAQNEGNMRECQNDTPPHNDSSNKEELKRNRPRRPMNPP